MKREKGKALNQVNREGGKNDGRLMK